jgi:hypothetical protein
MKNAKDAHFWQIDHKVKRIAEVKQVEVLSSPSAWEKYTWSRKYFRRKPEEGYFVWVKEQPKIPLQTCVNIVAKNIKQIMTNLLIVEEGLKIELEGFCGNVAACFNGAHLAQGSIYIKRNSSVTYRHIHSWEPDNVIEPNYEFLLEENARLDYVYKTTHTPKILKVWNKITCLKGAKVSIKILVDCQNTDFFTEDAIILKGYGSSGISRLRFIAGENSNIKAHSLILAKSASTGHLDCQSLITARSAKVSLVPEVLCEEKEAQVTHEASIGKVSEEQLNYLRSRGLTEEQALNLIISGFLRM